MQKSGLIAGITALLTVAVIAWFWSPTPVTSQGKYTLKKATARATTPSARPTVVIKLRSAQGLKLDPARNVLPDLPAADLRQKNAWNLVVREVQEMNEADHERFAAAFRGWAEVPVNKELLAQIKAVNEGWAKLTPEVQEAQIAPAEALYQTGLASLRQRYTETPAGLPVAPISK